MKEILIYLFIYLISTAGATQSFNKEKEYVNDGGESKQQLISNEFMDGLSQVNKTKPYQLSSSIFAEALQELCPFPGFKGNYCPGEMVPKYEYASSFESNLLQMPQGVGVSFDITTGDLKLPVIQLTYDDNFNQIWTDFETKIQYKVPQEYFLERVELQADVKIFKDEFELANTWLDASERGEWLGGQYSSSKDVHELYEKYFGGQYQTSISQQAKKVHRVAFHHDTQKLNKPAQKAINSLSKEYNEEIYKEFLDSWGTHISMDTYIGGMIEKETIFKDCLYSSSFTGTLSENEIQQALHNELQGKQGEAYFVARRRVSIDHKLGGNPEDETNWEKTIYQNPALLKINRFLSWDNFVSDPQIKSNLKTAIQNRVETVKQNFVAEKIKLEEKRRLQRQASKDVISVFASDSAHERVQINNTPHTMYSYEECPSGLAFKKTGEKCRVKFIDPTSLVSILSAINFGLYEYVLYERDYYGRFRAVFYDDEQYLAGDYQGKWVEKGCSMAQSNRRKILPNMSYAFESNSFPKIVCTDCIPEYVNGGKFSCGCPTF